jgi:hypothetical protein
MKWKNKFKVLQNKYKNDDRTKIIRRIAWWPQTIGETVHWLCYIYIKQELKYHNYMYTGKHYWYDDGDYVTKKEYDESRPIKPTPIKTDKDMLKANIRNK